MRIVEQSSDRLVLHQSPWGLRLTGVGMATLAAALLATLLSKGHRHDSGIWVAFVVCGMFAVAGLAMLLGATDRRIVLDRTRKVAEVIRRGGLTRAEATEIQFAEVRDVALETNPMIGSRHAAPGYRVVFVLRDGSRVPWTTVLTTDIGTQTACAAAARAFGGWDMAAARSGAAPTEIARPTPAPGVVAFRPTPRSVPAPAGATTPQRVGWVLAFLSIFIAVGVGLLGLQVERLITWRAVPAVVTSTGIQSVHGSKGGTSYRPVVTYRYRVDGRAYAASTVTIILESRSWDWATGIVARYPRGSTTTAYVDPKDPTKAFLVRQVSVIPLVFLIIPLVFAGIVWMSARQQDRQLALAASAPVPILTPVGATQPRAA